MRGELRQMLVKQGSGIKKSGRVFGQGKRNAKTVRAGLYARVSSLDQQTLPCRTRLTHHNTSCTSCQMRKGNSRFH